MRPESESDDLEIEAPPPSPEQEKRTLTAYFEHMLEGMDSSALAAFRTHCLSRRPMAVESELLALLIEAHIAARDEQANSDRSSVSGILRS